MNKIIMDFGAVSTKTAYVEDGILKELFVDSEKKGSIVGNIYVGVVKNVVSKQFVFIDIGLSKNAFMQLNDYKEHAFLKYKKINIGQSIIVQVVKDETDEKGARVTTEIALSGRSVAIIPHNPASKKRVFVSAKIKDTQKGNEIEKFVDDLVDEDLGAIIRTNSKDMELSEIGREIEALMAKFKDMMQRGHYIKGPAILYQDGLYYGKSLKTMLSDKIDEVVINSFDELENVKNVLSEYGISERLKFYDEDINIFDNYSLEKQIKIALSTKVWLKSGGFIIIEKTEACYVVDINTGKFVTKKNKEKTVLKNNLEAAEEIAKQIRLRNLSGVIIVDFVDMQDEENTKWLMAHFKRELKKDRINVHFVNASSLNFVQITRKNTRSALNTYFKKACTLCDGEGYILNIDYIAEKIYNMVSRILRQTEFNEITINSNAKVINFLNNMAEFDKISQKYNAKITLNTIITGKIDYFEIEKSIQ